MSKKNIVILTASHPYKTAGLVAFDLMQMLKHKYNVVIITNSILEKNYEQTLSLKKRPIVNSRFLIILNIVIKKLFKINQIKSNPIYYMYGVIHKKKNSSLEKILKNLPNKVHAFIYLFPQNFLDTMELNELHQITGSPIFWYMMDMAPMTGGCHYAWDCLGYTNKCGSCPGIYSKNPNDITHQLWNQKRKNIQSSNIIPVAGTEWQMNQLELSSLFSDKNKYKILLPINENLFKPDCQEIARRKLGLPIDKKILFFGATSINDKRKGYKELLVSLISLKRLFGMENSSNIFLAIAGNKKNDIEIPFAHNYLGYLDYDQLALAYQAADIFLCPSIQDSGPMMINQSILSGTPVVSFEMGVAMDLVINNVTGFRVENGNSSEFANAINKILSLSENEIVVMKKRCRELGMKKTSILSVCEKWCRVLENEFVIGHKY